VNNIKYFAGIDIGSLFSKVVIIDENSNIKAYSILQSGAVYKGAAETAMNNTLAKAELSMGDMSYIISTGYGRARVPFADSQVTEISCHGRGANFVFPEVRTIIDIGGQDSKVIEVNKEGKAVKFAMNDKCAAGTGRFLEVMAVSLGVDLSEMSTLAEKSRTDVEISSMCTVFAESEVISLFAQGTEKADIALGVYRSIARRVTGLFGQVGKKERVAMTGGVAKSKGMVEALEKSIKTTLMVPEEPQIMGALGAALIAREKFMQA